MVAGVRGSPAPEMTQMLNQHLCLKNKSEKQNKTKPNLRVERGVRRGDTGAGSHGSRPTASGHALRHSAGFVDV